MNRTVVECGMRKIFLLDEFLPPDVRDGLLRHACESHERFAASDRTLADPEYTRVAVLRDLGPFKIMFERAIQAAWRDILLSLAMGSFSPTSFDLRLSRLQPGAYRKPRADALHADIPSTLTLLYVVGAQPRQYEGGDLRFFEYDPYDLRGQKQRRSVEILATPNSLFLFPSTLYYDLGEIAEGAPGYLNTCFLVDGHIAHASVKMLPIEPAVA